MKIAIPLDENQKEVCQVFARAPYFMIYENKEMNIIENPAANETGGAGVSVAQFLVDTKITTLLTPRCGQNAAEVFKVASIQIYKTSSTDAKENIDQLLNHQLEKLTHFHGGFHGIQ
ncbi:MAG: NifB/NifX family molybdenum-iron cluster-binding protein [Erysipelotrichaceae bacterium]